MHSLLNLSKLGFETLKGGVIGSYQGFVVGWGIIRFAHRHPAAQFQEADYQVAIAHICAEEFDHEALTNS